MLGWMLLLAVMVSVTPREEIPLLGGFHPDPSICRVGEDYYLATSSFTWYPGLPVYHSRDLRNWKICSHVLVGEKWRKLLTTLRNDFDGVYAPTIRHWGGRFYIIVNVNGYGGVLASSARAEGPWDEKKIGGHAAPSIFFDEDGTCWELHLDVPSQRDYSNDWVSYLQKFDVEKGVGFGSRIELPHAVVRRQVWAEGAHIYRIGKRYLLLQAEGGTGLMHSETAMWSDAVTGPYVPQEVNPVLTRRHRGKRAHLQSTGHADLVMTPDGKLYAVFLGQRFLPETTGRMLTPLARETFMCPAEIVGGNIFFCDDQLVEGAFEDPAGDFYESTMPGLKMKRPRDLSFVERRTLSTSRDGVGAALVYYRSRQGYFALRKNAAEIVLEECRGEKAEIVGRLPYAEDEADLELAVDGTEVCFRAGARGNELVNVGGVRSASVVADDPQRNIHNGALLGARAGLTKWKEKVYNLCV